MKFLNSLYTILLIGEISSSIVVFILLSFITAPYGKHSKKGWGVIINERIAWFLMEFPAAVVFAWIFFVNIKNINLTTSVFFFLWEIHYIYRTFVFPFILRGAKKNFPFVIIGMGAIFNIVNAFLNSYYVFHISIKYSNQWLYSPQFISGIILFIGGFVIHTFSDNLIIKLRKPGETEYKIPAGGLYEFVSNPNYLGELIEWTGWAIMTLSLPGFAFALFTIANLLPRAVSNHKWYLKHFPNYPRKRKIIIPYLF